MKKVLLFVSFIVSFFGCSKEESVDNQTQKQSIVGVWHLADVLENGKSLTGYTCNKAFDIDEFTSNGKVIVKYSDKNSSNVCVQYTENGTYTIVDNVLTEIQKNGDIKIYEAKFKIKELTGSSLKLEYISVYETDSLGKNPITTNYSEGEEIRIYKL